MREEDILDRIHRCGVIAVLVIDDPRHAEPLARALIEGGIDVMELTLRTSGAVEALRVILRAVPEMLAGIGTILTPEQVAECRGAGAAFGVSPGLNPTVVRRAQEAGLWFAPGIATPSDIEEALSLGCRVLKFFPAEPSGGLPYLKSVAAPYAHLGVRYIPLGGLNPSSAGAYLESPLVQAVGGSWIAPRDRIVQEDWPAITAAAREAREIVQSARGGGD